MQQLTQGFVSRIYGTEGHSGGVEGVVQIRDLRRLDSKSSGQTRYRISISDGQNSMQGMLSTSLNQHVEDGELKQGSIARIGQFLVSDLGKGAEAKRGHRIAIILQLEVLQLEAELIGNPVAMDQAQPAAPAAPNGGGHQAAAMKGEGAGAGATQRAAPSGNFTPLKALNPYSTRWRIKARVTNRSPVREWNKGPDNQGKLFSITLLDETGTEMRATFFREAVDKYYDMMQEGEVFIISGGRVKPAFRGSGYELNLDSRTEVEHVRDDTGIKQQVYDFVELSRLEAVPTKEVVDVIGVVKSSGSLANITTRTGRELLKLDLDLVDQSNTEVRTTLWAETAQACAEKVTTQPVLAIKGVRVGDFGGVSLSTTTSSQVSFNPDLPEAAALRQWFDAGGAQQASRKLTSAGGGGGGPTTPLEDIPIAERNTISDLNSGAIGLGEKPDWLKFRGFISHIKPDKLSYPSCPQEYEGRICRKKVIFDDASGGYRCERCQVVVTPVYRYIMNFCIQDSTGQHWLTAFDEEGQKIMGITADEMEALGGAEGNEEAKTAAVGAKVFQDYQFKVRAKMEDDRDGGKRLRGVCAGIEPVKYAKEARLLGDAIAQFGL